MGKNFNDKMGNEAAATYETALSFISAAEPPAVKKEKKSNTEFTIKLREKRSERLQALLTKENMKYLNETAKKLNVSRNELLNCLIEEFRNR